MAPTSPKIVKEIQKDINATIAALRTDNLLRDESGISIKGLPQNKWSISYSTRNDSGSIIYDKNIGYSYLMEKLLQNRQYTILLYDMSIVQVEFLIQNNEIIKERLVFMKKHNIIWDPDEINEWEINDEPWFENDTGVPIVFRIDYEPDINVFKDADHPKTHFTLSNHECCRVAMKGIVTCSEFMKFIIKNFYDKELQVIKYRYDYETITANEKQLIHLNWS